MNYHIEGSHIIPHSVLDTPKKTRRLVPVKKALAPINKEPRGSFAHRSVGQIVVWNVKGEGEKGGQELDGGGWGDVREWRRMGLADGGSRRQRRKTKVKENTPKYTSGGGGLFSCIPNFVFTWITNI